MVGLLAYFSPSFFQGRLLLFFPLTCFTIVERFHLLNNEEQSMKDSSKSAYIQALSKKGTARVKREQKTHLWESPISAKTKKCPNTPSLANTALTYTYMYN